MSKAFTKDDADTPDVVPMVHLNPGERRLVTWDGFRAMQQELAQLLDEERPRLAGSADLEIQSRLKALDARIASLQARLSVVTPADPPADASRVFFGARVKVRDGSGKVKTWRIVGPDEADAQRGLISVQSPIAKALLGKARGEQVDVELPRGDDELTILDVGYDH